MNPLPWVAKVIISRCLGGETATFNLFKKMHNVFRLFRGLNAQISDQTWRKTLSKLAINLRCNFRSRSIPGEFIDRMTVLIIKSIIDHGLPMERSEQEVCFGDKRNVSQ